MKRILVPFDFSANAKAALQYALNLATISKAQVDILFVYSLFDASPVGVSNPKKAPVPDPVAKAHNDVQAVVKKLSSGKNVKTDIIIADGIPENRIADTARKRKSSLIIMGQTGNSVIQRFFVGSTTAYVLRYSTIPVLVIPKSYKPGKVKRVVFTTDLSSESLKHINDAAEYARVFEAEMVFLYIDTGSVLTSDVRAKEMTEKLAKKIRYSKVSGFICEDITIREGIDYYLSHHKADLVIMVSHHYTFPQTLWKRSLTRKLSGALNIPLLALVEKK